MKTDIPLNSPENKRASEILSACVHCGFCLATCPTYQQTGNELNSPRGRIYLIKSLLESNKVSSDTTLYLDQCLLCRSCETTCPSGVNYHQLVTIAKDKINQKRPLWQKMYRLSVATFLTTPNAFNFVAPFVRHSKVTSELILPKKIIGKVLLVDGCVQPSLAPNINHQITNILASLHYDVMKTAQQACCGAIDKHLENNEAAIKQIKNNIDHWFELLKNDVENVISSASGCGLMIKDYPDLFDEKDSYKEKAQFVADKTLDIAEFLLEQDLSDFTIKAKNIAYQTPCTMQHGLKLKGIVEKILAQFQIDLPMIKDSHLCCGSAGTYSIFQKKMADQLGQEKIKNLEREQPDVIVTSNIGCLMHLQKKTKTPVKHWVELLTLD